MVDSGFGNPGGVSQAELAAVAAQIPASLIIPERGDGAISSHLDQLGAHDAVQHILPADATSSCAWAGAE